jgi:pyrroloquinoline quinone biosynthesis protein E
VDIRSLPTPEPVPDLAAYAANRERALAADPVRRANYERYLKSSRRCADPDYLPIKLDIENVSRCNLRCTMCVVGDWPKGRRADDMALDAFKALIDEQRGLLEIKLQGIGEPTMQGDAYFRMIRYARDRHIWVRTTTNATLLHLKDNHRRLIDSDVNEVQISIDGADRQTYETIRRGGKFYRVARNCAAINAYCAERGMIRTKMWTVVQRGNVHQLPDLVRFAAEHGFKRQVFSLQLSDWAMERWHARNAAASAEPQLDPARLMELVALGERLGVTVRFWTVSGKYATDRPENLCPWPFERAYVSSDLKVVPCCYVGNPEVFALGTLENGFAAAWHGEAMRAFRRAHLDGRPPQVCRSCYA